MADTGQQAVVTNNGTENTAQQVAMLLGPPSESESKEALARIVEDVLKARGIPAPLAAPMAHDAQELIKTAAKTVPSWVIYAGLLIGGPGLAGFYATAENVWGLPERVAAIEQTQADQGKILAEIKGLLMGPTSKPR